MMSTTTAVSLINFLTLNVGIIIGAVVVAILILIASLLGLGWGKRKVEQHITGKATFASTGDPVRDKMIQMRG